MEKDDASIVDTALRECSEEIGVTTVAVLGLGNDVEHDAMSWADSAEIGCEQGSYFGSNTCRGLLGGN